MSLSDRINDTYAMPLLVIEEIRKLEARLEVAERERDEWKAQAEEEAVICGSYRDERDALAVQVETLNGILFDTLLAAMDDGDTEFRSR